MLERQRRDNTIMCGEAHVPFGGMQKCPGQGPGDPRFRDVPDLRALVDPGNGP